MSGKTQLNGSRPSMRKRQSLTAAFGLMAAFLEVAMPLLAGWTSPGYDHLGQYLSELGERGAVHGPLVSLGGFLPIGLLVLAFLLAGLPVLRWNRRTTAALICLSGVGWGYIIAGLAPCDPGCPWWGSLTQNLHTLAGFVHYGGAAAGLFLFASAARSSPQWQPVSRWTWVAALFVLAGISGMLLLESSRGLSQRVAELAFFGWMVAVCIRVLRSAPAT